MAEAQFEAKLAALLKRRIPGFVSLLSAERLSGGASQETYRLAIRDGRVLLVQKQREKLFAGGSDDEPAADRGERGELTQKCEVVLERFSESDSGINPNPLGNDPHRGKSRAPSAVPPVLAGSGCW